MERVTVVGSQMCNRQRLKVHLSLAQIARRSYLLVFKSLQRRRSYTEVVKGRILRFLKSERLTRCETMPREWDLSTALVVLALKKKKSNSQSDETIDLRRSFKANWTQLCRCRSWELSPSLACTHITWETSWMSTFMVSQPLKLIGTS